MKWFLTVVALLPIVCGSSVVCPGEHFKCPDSATCCQLPDKSYGCCPMPNAVCCDDHIHCCPEGHKCDGGMCIQSDFFNMTAKLSKKNEKHLCPGEQYSCPDSSTCCESPGGGTYGCCLLPDAICCADGEHCCPKDSECDLAKSRCIGKDFVMQMYDAHKEGNKPKERGYVLFSEFTSFAKKVESVFCPGDTYQCPDGYTCCKLPSGQWGCCPFPNAVCCSDHLHCCPAEMKCSPTSQSCLQGIRNITWSINEPAQQVNESKDVVCPDEKYHCPKGSTCCQLDSGEWGCCPYLGATCCSDHQHCCPYGLECDVLHQQCKKGMFKTPWQKKFRAESTKVVVDYI